MTSFRESVSSSIREKFCEFAAKTGPFARFLYPISRELNPFGGLSYFDEPLIPGGLASLVCDIPPPSYPPARSVPFTGGQCETLYRYSWVYRYVRPSGTIDESGTPGTPNFSQYPTPRPGPFRSGPQPRPGRPTEWVVQDGDGFFNNLTFLTEGGTFEVNEFYLQRADGQPDDCGNPEPVALPPFEGDDNQYDININFDAPDGTTVNFPADLTFAFPIFNVNGDLSIPFTIENLDLKLEGEFNLNVDEISFNFNGNSGNEKCCLDEGTDSEPPETEDDPPDEGETRDIIVGVVVTSTDVANRIRPSIYGQGDGPDYYHPRLGNVYFVVEVSGRRLWTGPQSVNVRQQFIQCPAQFGAVEVVGYPQQGITWTLTPIYRRISETEYPSL